MSQLEVDKVIPQSGTTLTLGESGDTVSIPSGATLDSSNATVTYPAGSITDAAISSTAAIQQSKILGSPGFRNIIINGDMSIDQRNAGVSIVNPGASSVTYTCDRLAVRNATDAVVNVIQSTDSPNANFTNSLELDVTTLDSSIAAGQVYTVQQRVEGLNISSLGFGKAGTRYCTISFWHKHTKTGTYCVGLTNSAGNRAYPAEYTQSVADTWEYSTISAIPVDTTGTWLMTNGIGLIVYFVVAAGTNFHGTVDTWSAANTFATANQVNALDSTSNFFRITGVQLEAGTTASDFEFLPVDVNLARCQRYFYKWVSIDSYNNLCMGRVTAGTEGRGVYAYPQIMRATPSLSADGNFRVVANNAVTLTGGDVTLNRGNTNTTYIQMQGSGSAMTIGQCCEMGANNDSDAEISFSAEL
jgi:hypothetical protein